MTRERQDITEDFYAGNYKEIHVTCYNQDNSLKDLTNAEVTYAIFTNANESEVLLMKSSNQGTDYIDILDPPTDGELLIKLKATDTVNISGTHRHHVNVVDSNGHEETVLSGKIQIFRSFARRFRISYASAYTIGG